MLKLLVIYRPEFYMMTATENELKRDPTKQAFTFSMLRVQEEDVDRIDPERKVRGLPMQVYLGYDGTFGIWPETDEELEIEHRSGEVRIEQRHLRA